MRVLVSGRGAHAVYKDVRGPTGARFAEWKQGLRKRALERFGLDELLPDGRINPEARRLMRSARKRERHLP